ncbi:MAG: hypothetical protein KF833_02160 [Verrucomicrobiae bacterium]|nr:hypothetical protein [Verrucomicrobiae bacterium]
MNPYMLLRVARDAGDADIRRAYLGAIREATPETHPVLFNALREAYERIRDESSRCRDELFGQDRHGDSPVEVAVRHWRLGPRPGPMTFESMKEYLTLCAKK